MASRVALLIRRPASAWHSPAGIVPNTFKSRLFLAKMLSYTLLKETVGIDPPKAKKFEDRVRSGGTHDKTDKKTEGTAWQRKLKCVAAIA